MLAFTWACIPTSGTHRNYTIISVTQQFLLDIYKLYLNTALGEMFNQDFLPQSFPVESLIYKA